MTITLGWWLLPLAATAGVWIWCFWPDGYTGLSGIGGAIMDLLKLGAAIIATLTAWLVYFIAV